MDNRPDARAVPEPVSTRPAAWRQRARAATALLAASAVVLVAAPAAPGSVPKKRVTVADNFFDPANFKVRKGTRIVWRWSRDNSARHDVKLVRGPRGVRRFRSEAATTGYVFRRKLRKRGKYKVICTFHRVLMRQTITVR